MEEQRSLKQRRILVIIISIIFALLLIGAIIAAIINSKYSATLDLLVAPRDATILIDGKPYKNGQYNFEPGEITVNISMDGFTSEEQQLTLKAGETTKYYTYLIPTDGSLDWYLEHEDDMMLMNTIGDANAALDSNEYLEENPIVEVLPIIYANYDKDYNYTEFRVDGGKFDNCKESFCLKITDTTGGNREHALELIREKGFNPDDYEIIYEYDPIKPLE